MRNFELIFTTILFFIIILSFMRGKIIKFLNDRRYVIYCTYASAVLFALLGICLEGFRFIMLPFYLIALILCLIEVVRTISWHIVKSIPTGEKSITKKKHRILRAFGKILLCVIFVLAIILAWYFPVKNLPKPSGDSKVGTVIMDFTNPTRTNILTGATESQKIAAQIWYPTLDTKGKQRANWMMDRKVASLFAQREGLPDIFGQLSLVETNSYLNAPLSTQTEKYPVVLFSGGGGMFSGQNVIQMEELASNGFIVVAVSHPADDFATLYSDGTVLGYDNQLSDALSEDMSQAISYMKSKYNTDEATPEMQRTTLKVAKLSNEEVKVWAEDIIFIANQLEKMNDGSIESIFQGKMGTSQFGVFGHSLGGAAAGQTCIMDNRFKAFINIDGSPFGDAVDHTITQPFMVLETGSDSSMKFRARDGYSPEQTNYLVVSVEETEHMNYTDLNTILPIIGKSLGILGKIDNDKQTKITNAYVLAFFNHYLKGSSEALLENAEAPYSEVSVSQR